MGELGWEELEKDSHLVKGLRKSPIVLVASDDIELKQSDWVAGLSGWRAGGLAGWRAGGLV